jgi:hypothetical protein
MNKELKPNSQSGGEVGLDGESYRAGVADTVKKVKQLIHTHVTWHRNSIRTDSSKSCTENITVNVRDVLVGVARVRKGMNNILDGKYQKKRLVKPATTNLQSRNAVIAEVEKLLIAELLIAQKEGQPTSRLTSLAVGINALKTNAGKKGKK